MKERLKTLRTYLGLNQRELAEKLGITQSSYANYENKGSRISADILNLLMKQFYVNPDWLLYGQGEMLLQDGLYPVILPGPGSDNQRHKSPRVLLSIPLLDQESILRENTVNESVSRPSESIRVIPGFFHPYDAEHIRSTKVSGDSMEVNGTGFCHGDLCFYTTRFEENGDGVYIINLEEQVMLKRLQFTPGQVSILSDNPRYQPIHLKKNTLDYQTYKIIGKVIANLHLYR